MTRAYWDALAANYEQEIFSVLAHDDAGLIRNRIERFGGSRRTAADLGCGPGQVTPLLAAAFRQVHACDVSVRLLQRARRQCADFDNIVYHRQDLAAVDEPDVPPVDLVVCINVLLSPDLETRDRLWQRVTSRVAAGGRLLLVVPSLESALYTNSRRLDWHVRAGFSPAEAVQHAVAQEGNVAQLECGVRTIEDVATKHYLREEIIAQLADQSLFPEEIIQLTYDWETEFANPPDWLGEPFPWNWLVVAARGED